MLEKSGQKSHARTWLADPCTFLSVWDATANRRDYPIVVSMSGQRLRRWPHIEKTLGRSIPTPTCWWILIPILQPIICETYLGPRLWIIDKSAAVAVSSLLPAQLWLFFAVIVCAQGHLQLFASCEFSHQASWPIIGNFVLLANIIGKYLYLKALAESLIKI